jgi:hypothetical protein
MDKALQGRPTNEMAGEDDNNSNDDYSSDKNNICAPVDTEIFEVASNQTAVASLSSHINALKRLLLPMAYGSQSSPALPYASETEPGRANYLRNLPSVPRIQSLTRLYFEHLNNFFPCLDDAQFQERLARIEVDQVVSEGDRLCLVVQPSSRSFVMSMCMVLAVATYLDPSSHQGQDNNTAPGWRYVRMAEEIARRDHNSSGRSVGIDLDLVRYHTVRAMYMIHVERLTAAAHAIGTATQLAFNAGLNDESTWGSDCSDTDRCARRLLWWTIFYMDRRVAQKCWKPYLIRENEVLVEDVVQMPESPIFSSGVFDVQETYSETEGKVLLHRYVQTAVSWARLWAVVWDTMFAARAPRGESRLEEIEVLDARLLHAQRQIHESLQWETCLLPSYMAAGETEAHIRSRLVACVVCHPRVFGPLSLLVSALKLSIENESSSPVDPTVMQAYSCVRTPRLSDLHAACERDHRGDSGIYGNPHESDPVRAQRHRMRRRGHVPSGASSQRPVEDRSVSVIVCQSC